MEGYLVEEKKSGKAPKLCKTLYEVIKQLKNLGANSFDHEVMMKELSKSKKFDLMFSGRRIVVQHVTTGGKAK